MVNSGEAMDLEHARSEIAHLRHQIRRKQAELVQLQRSGIRTDDAETVLQRMQDRLDELCAERDRLVGEQRRTYAGRDKAIRGPLARRV